MSDLPKHWISAEQLLLDSLRLAAMVLADGYRPSVVVGLWRGGAPVAVAVHEALAVRGLRSAHLPLVTRLYTGMDTRAGQLQIEGLALLEEHLAAPARILLVDDVFDTGITLSGVMAAIAGLPGAGREIRTATPWYKPGRNRSTRTPDYWIHASDDWLVFPHEMEGLSEQELRTHRGDAFMQALGGEAEAERSGNPRQLVRLQAETPPRVRQAIRHRGSQGCGSVGPVHGLQEETGEVETLVARGIRARLRIHQLQFVTALLHQRRTGLGTHTDPVDAAWRRDGAIGLHGDLEIPLMNRFEQRFVQLQQRLATGEHNQWARAGRASRPVRENGVCERLCGREAAAARTIRTHEIGVAEAADCPLAVLLAAAPQVAACKAAEHRGTPAVGALALQREKEFLDGVAHGEHSCGEAPKRCSSGSAWPAAAKPRARSWQESQEPQGRPSGEGS